MPTIKTKNGFRFFIYANDHPPASIYVEKDGETAKFYLAPIEIESSRRFNASELRKIRVFREEDFETF
ncbi:MAG: DUF4160 domain-containing protein [Bacteroidia bacterium]